MRPARRTLQRFSLTPKPMDLPFIPSTADPELSSRLGLIGKGGLVKDLSVTGTVAATGGVSQTGTGTIGLASRRWVTL